MRIGMKKATFSGSTGSKQVRFHKFSMSQGANGTLQLHDGKNCTCIDGVVRNAFSLKRAKSTVSGMDVQSMEFSPSARLIPLAGYQWGEIRNYLGVTDDVGYTYYYDEDTLSWRELAQFYSFTKALPVIDVEGNARTLFLYGNEASLYTYGESVQFVDLGELKGMATVACVVQGRVFFRAGDFKMRYSAPFNVEDVAKSIDDGGEIIFPTERGQIVGAVGVNDTLYVFHKNSISYVQVSANASDFRVQTIGYSGGKILAGSMGVDGVNNEDVIFQSEGGVYRLRNKKVEGICQNIDVKGMYGGRDTVNVTFDGMCYLVYTNNKGKRDAVLINLHTGEGCRASVIERVSMVEGRAMCVYNNKVYEMHAFGDVPSGEECFFYSNNLTLNWQGVKCLETVYLSGNGRVQMTLGNGYGEKKYTVNFVDGQARIRTNMRGKNFSVRFDFSSDACVEEMHVDVRRAGKITEVR